MVLNERKKINSALISVYHKDNLEPLIKKLQELNITIYSTGGTFNFICGLGIKAVPVEDLTTYPSILGGRVKTLHPKVFGGILARRDNLGDIEQLQKYEIPQIDLVIVDLYPFEETVASRAAEEEIIEKIDIGGISLIRAAAKNFNDVVIISSSEQYNDLFKLLDEEKGFTTLAYRKNLALKAFNISSHYDTAIFNYFNSEKEEVAFKQSIIKSTELRYGENPHQKGWYHGDLDSILKQYNGKAISYNNLLDIDAAVCLIQDFEETTFAIIKHNNACGIASREILLDAWKDALACDPVSAFGGVLISNRPIDISTAEEINKLFFEVVIAPDYEKNTLEILKAKKNRVILQINLSGLPGRQFKSVLNGVIEQERDLKTETISDFQVATVVAPTKMQLEDLVFANKMVKHTKSNAIILVKNKQLLASGTGQTSRVDALQQAVAKAKTFGFDLKDAVMASDAFFPFPDCVEIAYKEGVSAVIQPGGSINDKASIEFCNNNGVAMVITGFRHFKH